MSDFMSFEELRIHPHLLRSVKELGFEAPTPVQQAAIPLLLQGSDVIAQAQTGTGKTAAFAIAILQTIQPGSGVQAIILVPTRELALQVVQEFHEIGKYCRHRTLAVYGGASMSIQVGALRRGVDVVVGTPGRVLDHLHRGTLSLANVKIAVLDEADRMLDMGFIDDVQKILAYTPEQKQVLLFSATMPEAIVELVRSTMVQPERVNVSPSITVAELSQHYVSVDPKKKLSSLVALLKLKKPALSLVFVRTKRGADTLNRMLTQRGFRNVCLHGDLSQSCREKHMSLFRGKKVGILVATDVAARGLDVDDIDLVVNYNLPEEEDNYVHRVGRTARAGKKGDAVSFVTNVMEKRLIDDFALKTRSKIDEIELFPGQKVKLGDAPSGAGHAGYSGGRHQRMPMAFHSYRR